MFPVRYELSSYINLLRNSVFKGLNHSSQTTKLDSLYFTMLCKYTVIQDWKRILCSWYINVTRAQYVQYKLLENKLLPHITRFIGHPFYIKLNKQSWHFLKIFSSIKKVIIIQRVFNQFCKLCLKFFFPIHPEINKIFVTVFFDPHVRHIIWVYRNLWLIVR
jgi:hypothetical protein